MVARGDSSVWNWCWQKVVCEVLYNFQVPDGINCNLRNCAFAILTNDDAGLNALDLAIDVGQPEVVSMLSVIGYFAAST